MKPSITPGEILIEDDLIPMGISQNDLKCRKSQLEIFQTAPKTF
jgi:plasmid maintenance system antidote protein VapI